jgi:PIN domain nuclease of toxin-antitoxin system
VKLLLDSHVFLWACADDRKLKAEARKAIAHAETVYVSVVTAWELTIKARLGRLSMPEPPMTAIVRAGFEPLLLEFRHVLQFGTLHAHHGDPFDRMLVAQAMATGAHLVTHDAALGAYGIDILWT